MTSSIEKQLKKKRGEQDKVKQELENFKKSETVEFSAIKNRMDKIQEEIQEIKNIEINKQKAKVASLRFANKIDTTSDEEEDKQIKNVLLGLIKEAQEDINKIDQEIGKGGPNVSKWEEIKKEKLRVIEDAEKVLHNTFVKEEVKPEEEKVVPVITEPKEEKPEGVAVPIVAVAPEKEEPEIIKPEEVIDKKAEEKLKELDNTWEKRKSEFKDKTSQEYFEAVEEHLKKRTEIMAQVALAILDKGLADKLEPKKEEFADFVEAGNKGVENIPKSKKTKEVEEKLNEAKQVGADKKVEISKERAEKIQKAKELKIPKEELLAKGFTEEELVGYSLEDTTKSPDSTPTKPVGETAEEKILREGNIEVAQKKLDDARIAYGAEYKKCLDKMKNEKLIDKTRSSIYNIFAKTRNIFHKNKIETTKALKEEDFYTEKMKELKKEYEEEKIKFAKVLLEEKEKELKAQGLTGEDLKQALLAYKAGEFLDKTVLTERQKLIELKKQIPNTVWEKIRKAMTFSPVWARRALFISIGIIIGATSPFGAAFIAQYGIGALIGAKITTSLVVGATTSWLTPKILRTKQKDEKFYQEQNTKQQDFADKYARGEISIEQYEQEVENLEKEAKRREKLNMMKNAAVGILVGGIAGGLTFGGINLGLHSFDASHLTQVNIPHDQIIPGSGHNVPDTMHHNAPGGAEIPKPVIPVHHPEVSVSMDHGHGAIRGFHDLQEKLKVEYPDPSKAPANIQHILNSKPEALAQEYGMYKPGDVSESALIHKGAVISMDDKGNLTYSDPTTHEVDILAGSKAEDFHGRMMDTDHTAPPTSIVNENNLNTPDLNIAKSLDGELTKFETGSSFGNVSHDNAYDFMNNGKAAHPQEFSALQEIHYRVSGVIGKDIMPNPGEDVSQYTHRLHEALNVNHETTAVEPTTVAPHAETLGDTIHGIPKVQYEEQVKNYVESHGTIWSSPAEKAKDLWVWEHFGKVEKIGDKFSVVSPNENSTIWNTVSTYHTPAKELLAIPEPTYGQNLVIKPILELKNEVYLKTGLNIEPKPGEDCVQYVLELEKQIN